MRDLPSLLLALTSGDDARAEQAALELAEIAGEAESGLYKLLQTGDDDQRWWAIRSLAGFQQIDPVTLDAIIITLDHENPELGQCAALALCHHPYPPAIPGLIKSLTSPDVLLSNLAGSALRQIGKPALPGLLEVLKTGSQRAKNLAARAVAEIADPQTIPALMQIIQSDSALQSYWAEQGLNKLGLDMLYIQPNNG